MSDEENPSDETNHGSESVVIESVSSKPTQLYRPDHSPDEASSPSQKVVPTIINMSSERHKYVAKNLAASIPSKRRDASSVAIPLAPIQTDAKIDEVVVMTAPTQPIPVLGKSASPIPSTHLKDEKEEVDSITSEITELRTPEVQKKTPEWSDEEEASGLPRNESRASRTSHGSRVSRVVRQLFCCGMQLESPSEDNVSSPRDSFFHSGI